MKDIQCPICKTKCDEVMIAEDFSFDYQKFQQNKPVLVIDNDDPGVFYENGKSKHVSTKLRALQCMIFDCKTSYTFHTVEELKKHMEHEHQRTFCKICLKGRLVFIREQKVYPLKFLKNHI